MTAKKGKTVADFRNAHDRNIVIPNRIRTALAAMEKEFGQEHWEYEADLMKRAGVGPSDTAACREVFADHIVVAPPEPGSKRSPRNVWFATVKAAKQARGE